MSVRLRSAAFAPLAVAMLSTFPVLLHAQSARMAETNRQITAAVVYNQVGNEIVARGNQEIRRAHEVAQDAERRAREADSRAQEASARARAAEERAQTAARESRRDSSARRRAEAERDAARLDERAAREALDRERHALAEARQTFLREVEAFDVESKAYIEGLTEGVEALLASGDARVADALQRIANGDASALDDLAEFVDLAAAARARGLEARVAAMRRAEQVEAGKAMIAVAELFMTAYDAGRKSIDECISRWEIAVAADPESFEALKGLRDAILERKVVTGQRYQSPLDDQRQLARLSSLAVTDQQKFRLFVHCGHTLGETERAGCPGAKDRFSYMMDAKDAHVRWINSKGTMHLGDFYSVAVLYRQIAHVAAKTASGLAPDARAERLTLAEAYISDQADFLDFLEASWVPSSSVTWLLGTERSWMLTVRGRVAQARNQPEEAMRLHLEALDVLRVALSGRQPSASEARLLANALSDAADFAGIKSDGALVMQLRNEAVAVVRNAPVLQPMRLWFALSGQGQSAMRFGQLDVAAAAYRESIEIGRTYDIDFAVSLDLKSLGLVQLMTGDFEGARRSLDAIRDMTMEEVAGLQATSQQSDVEAFTLEQDLVYMEATLLTGAGALDDADRILRRELDRVPPVVDGAESAEQLALSGLVLRSLRFNVLAEKGDFQGASDQLRALRSAAALLSPQGEAGVDLYLAALDVDASPERLDSVIQLIRSLSTAMPEGSPSAFSVQALILTAERFRDELASRPLSDARQRLLLLAALSTGTAAEMSRSMQAQPESQERLTWLSGFWANALILRGLLRDPDLPWTAIAQELRSVTVQGWADTAGLYGHLALASARERQEAAGTLPQ